MDEKFIDNFWIFFEIMLNCTLFIDAYLTHINPLSSRNFRIKILSLISFILAFFGNIIYWHHITEKLGGLNITFLDRYDKNK